MLIHGKQKTKLLKPWSIWKHAILSYFYYCILKSIQIRGAWGKMLQAENFKIPKISDLIISGFQDLGLSRFAKEKFEKYEVFLEVFEAIAYANPESFPL